MNEIVALDEIHQTIQQCTKKPEHYLSVQESLVENLKNATKSLYDLAFKKKLSKNTQALPELIIEDFDAEQIWQQLELENKEEFSRVGIENVSRTLTSKNWELPLRTLAQSDKENGMEAQSESEISRYQDENESENEDENEDEVSDNASEEDVPTENFETKSKRRKKGSEVNDKFFKIEEMNRFLKMEDQKEFGKKQEVDSDDEELESIDLFNDIPDSGDEDADDVQIKYDGFFDSPDSGEEQPPLFEQSDSEDEGKVQSSLEKRRERLEKRINELEDQAVSDKPWQLKGEVSSKDRPVNSLLEEYVEFDQVTRPAPVMTEQTSMKLEDIIRNRIKDKAWDDVEKKVKPVDTPMEYKKKLIMNQEKSKESLAQIYENEYIKQREALASDDKEEQEPEEPPEHNEIRELMHSLFIKLDALSNFHYTPKPAKPEIKIISNVAAISMEEVAPVATSDAVLLAPEEIQSKQKGDLIGKSERTKTDMKRARRKKKLKQQARALHASEKSVQDLKQKKSSNHKASKLKGRNIINMDDTASGKAIKSSTAFFSQLQDQVARSINTKTSTTAKKNKSALSAVKLKL